MTGGDLQVEYTTSKGLFISYRDKTPLTTCIQNIQYADDMTLIAETRGKMQCMLDVSDRACIRWGMKVSGDKTKVLNIGELTGDHLAITLNGHALQEVESVSYSESEVDTDCQGGERCWNQTGEGSNCLANVEMEDVQESKPQQDNQSAFVSINGHVSPSLQCRDLASNLTRHQKTEDLPDEMPLGHLKSDPVGQAT